MTGLLAAFRVARPLSLILIVIWQVQAYALSPCFHGSNAVQLQYDCSWQGGSKAVTVSGALGQPTAGPPAIVAPAGAAQAGQSPVSAELTYALLSGFKLPSPSSPQQGLVPIGLVDASGVASKPSLSLRDVRILVDLPTLQQHLEFFRKVPDVAFYTDESTYLHVNFFSNGRVSWQSVGLLLAASLQDARSTLGDKAAALNNSRAGRSSSNSDKHHRRHALAASTSPASTSAAAGVSKAAMLLAKYNYVLAADNDTLVLHIKRLGGVGGARPCLIYLASNVTLTKPPVPAAGIPVARPMALVGMASHNTSIDFHMQVNQLLLNYTWSNITFDSLAVENLAPGDAMSAELAKPLSVSSANNMWPLYYNRSEDRFLMKNVTLVMGSQAELDYYMYWATVYHSKLPYFKSQAQFIKDVIQMMVWKVGWQTDTSIQVIRSYSGSCRVVDCIYRLQPVVFPRLPPPQLRGPDLKLKPAEKSALVTAVGDAQALQDQLQPLTGSEASRVHVILLRSNITLQPQDNSSTAGSNSSSNSSLNSTPAANLTSYPPAGIAAGGIPVRGPLSIVGDLSADADYATTKLHLGFARDLLDASGDKGGKGQVQVQHLRLQGLAQGPGAAAAADLQSPQVWTLLAWAFKRSADNDVILSGCVLELPPPEFEQLAQLARQGGGQVVLKLKGDVRSVGDGLVVLSGVTNHQPSTGTRSSRGDSSSSSGRRLLAGSTGIDNNSLWVDSLSAQGVSGSKLVLVPSAAAVNMPGGYFWPGSNAAAPAPAGMSNTALAVAVAVPLGVLLVAAVVWLLMARRRRRWQLRNLPDVVKSSAGIAVGPSSSRRSSYGSARPTADMKQAALQLAVRRECSSDDSQLLDDQRQLQPRAPSATSDGCTGAAAGRTSMDVATCSDDRGSSSILILQSNMLAAAVKSGAMTAAAGFTNTASSSASSAAVDSARSLPLASAPGNAGMMLQEAPISLLQSPVAMGDAAAMQQHTGGLSHRLTSAISHLQHDITRRRISCVTSPPAQQEQQQQSSGASDRRSLEGTLVPAALTVAAAPAGANSNRRAGSTASAGSDSVGARGTSSSNDASSSPHSVVASGQRQRCSLVAARSPALAESAAAIASGAAPAELQVLTLIGRGSFACVYRAIWRGRCVALKVVQLPAGAAGEGDADLGSALQTRERMAVMEAVLSVTMSHPNIVQVYTFALQPLVPDPPAVEPVDSSAGGRRQLLQQREGGYSLQLIMEYCEEGSLRAALNQQRLVDPSSPLRLPALHLVLGLAHDVACAMLHLHSEHIVHSDLKASNVLLTKGHGLMPWLTAGTSQQLEAAPAACGLRPGSCAALLAAAQAAAGGRLVGKVADFGLSLSLDPESTHISHMFAGTLTHMAPELLLHGRASKASDVYAFGILLWELATGLRAFQGQPVALVGHNVTQLGLRPPWVPGVAPPLKQLVEDCWAQEPNERPSFSNILLRLEHMLQQTPQELSRVEPQVNSSQPQTSSSQQQPAPDTTAALATQQAAAGVAQAVAAGGDTEAAWTGDWTM